MSPFKQKVIIVVQAIPHGKVASYGQVALMVGIPRGARQVGWIMHGLDRVTADEILPWWRVVNNVGRISIKGNSVCTPEVQQARLEAEGIIVAEDFTFPIEEYRWRPTMDELQGFQLDDEYVSRVLEKFGV